MAPLAGWASAMYLRGGTPTERVAPFRWRIAPRSGPVWAMTLSAVATTISVLIVFRTMGTDVGLAVGLAIGWYAVCVLVQAAFLWPHNQRVQQPD
jgi:hypothetical protein